MKFAKPGKLSLFQLLIAFLLVAFLASPSDAMHGWKLSIRGNRGKGSGGSGQVATILAAGLVAKLLSEIHKHKKVGGGFSGGYQLEGLGMGQGMRHGMGQGMGHGMGYGMEYGMGYGNGLGDAFESHDAHLGLYGYEPQGIAWAK